LNTDKIIRDIVSRRSPDGSYLVISLNSSEAKKIILQYSDISVEESGYLLVVKSRSRRVIEELARKLLARGFLVVK